jgi:hypothetical protein
MMKGKLEDKDGIRITEPQMAGDLIPYPSLRYLRNPHDWRGP